MGKVRTGAKAIVKEPALKFFWKETTRELSKEYKDYEDSKWDNKTGALKATGIPRKQPTEKESICVLYLEGEDTKGCTDLSCGFVKFDGTTTIISYTGKHLELRCQDVLYKKGCVCVLLPDEEKDPNTGNIKSSVDCLFMMDGMDEPVRADIKSVSLYDNEDNEEIKAVLLNGDKDNEEIKAVFLNGDEKNKKIKANQVGNIISRAEKQAKKNDTEYMILYYDNAANYDKNEVDEGLKLYKGKKDRQIKNVIIVVNDKNQSIEILR